MKARWLGVGTALLLGGCASVEMAQYTVTSFAEVPLKDKARVKIVANGDALTPIATALTDEFKKSGVLQVVEENADYWFVLNGSRQYLESVPQKTVSVDKQENESGGTEVLTETDRNLASAATGVSVAVYETKTLAPVHYLEVPIYSGDNTNAVVRKAADFEAQFAAEVVERVKDVFITQQKQVETPMPLEADGSLRELFTKGGVGFAKGDRKAYTPFLQRYRQIGATDLAKLCEQLRTKTYEGSDADLRLGNYYLYLLVKEALVQDPAELKKIQDEQMMILRASDAKGLVEAVPVALARLEYKRSNLGE